MAKVRRTKGNSDRVEYVCNGYHRYSTVNRTSHRIREETLDEIVQAEFKGIRLIFDDNRNDIIAENNISNANLHMMFDKIVIEETEAELNLDLRMKLPFISKKKEQLLKKYMVVNDKILNRGA